MWVLIRKVWAATSWWANKGTAGGKREVLFI